MSSTTEKLWFCEYCLDNATVPVSGYYKYSFDSQQDFVEHLKGYHLVRKAKEGGHEFICCYGPGGNCVSASGLHNGFTDFTSNANAFISQHEYERHLVKDHLIRKCSQSEHEIRRSSDHHYIGHRFNPSTTAHSVDKTKKWNAFQSIVNLPALLNDPVHRETDIFTKVWGDKFENVELLPSPHLPEITMKEFEQYLNKACAKNNSRSRYSVSAQRESTGFASGVTTIDNRLYASHQITSLHDIPNLYFDKKFNLSNEITFSKVVPLQRRHLKLTSGEKCANLLKEPANYCADFGANNTRQMEEFLFQHEKLANYLDFVETHISHQVSKKSSVFFQAIQSHDGVREDLREAINQIKLVRTKLKCVDSGTISRTMKLLRVVRRRENYHTVLNKLKLIAGLQTTQPSIQNLLRTGDYCAALDLVAVTKDLLNSPQFTDPQSSRPINKNNFHCLRNMEAELNGYLKIIHNTVVSEFEYVLKQFLDSEITNSSDPFEPDLLSCFHGLIGIDRLDFVSAFHAEMLKRIKHLFSSTMQSLLSDSISDNSGNAPSNSGILKVLNNLSFVDWANFMQSLCDQLTSLLSRGQAVVDIFAKHFVPSLTETDTTGKVAPMLMAVTPSDRKQAFPTNKIDELLGRFYKTMWDAANAGQKRLIPLMSAKFHHSLKPNTPASVSGSLSGNISATTTTSTTTPNNTPTVPSTVNTTTQSSKPYSLSVSFEIADEIGGTCLLDSSNSKLRMHEFGRLVNAIEIVQLEILKAWLQYSKPIFCNSGVQQRIEDQLTKQPVSNFLLHFVNDEFTLHKFVFALIRQLLDEIHEHHLMRLNILLDQERWQVADCGDGVQELLDNILKNGEDSRRLHPKSNDKNKLIIGKEEFSVASIIPILLYMITDYIHLADQFPYQPVGTKQIIDRLTKLLNLFNSRTCQLILGAEAREKCDLRRISAKILAVALRSLQLIVTLMPYVRATINRIVASQFARRSNKKQSLPPTQLWGIVLCQLVTTDTLLNDLMHVESLFYEHINDISNTLTSLLSSRIAAYLANWNAKPPIPSKELRDICRNLSKLTGMTCDVLPMYIITSIIMDVHAEFKKQLRCRLSELGILADGGPQQSLVDSEIHFYLNHIRTLTPQLEKFQDDCADVWPS